MAKRNYPDFCSFKLKLFALKWAVSDKFKAYTLGSHCTVCTDHNHLTHSKTANLRAIEHQWDALVASFDIDVRYMSGKTNRCADALSRCPADMSTEDTANVLYLAMDSTPVHMETRARQSHDVTLAELIVSEGALTLPVLPFYSLEQLVKMHCEDQLLGKL